MGSYQSIKKIQSKDNDNDNKVEELFDTIKIGQFRKKIIRNISSTYAYKQYGSSCYAYAASSAYINSIIRSNYSRVPPTFKDCYNIACYNGSNTGNPAESLRRLEDHFKFGVTYRIIKSEDFTIREALNISSIVSFTTSQKGWESVSNGELLEFPNGESNEWNSSIVEGYDLEKDCLICKNSWGKEGSKPKFLFNPRAAYDCYIILVKSQRKTSKSLKKSVN